MNTREIDRLVAEKVMGWKIYTDSAGYKFWSIKAVTAPLAICLAALEACGIEVEGSE